MQQPTPMEGWPLASPDWLSWVTRMSAIKKDLWIQTGIFDAIMISCNVPAIDKPLLFSSLLFWDCSTNTFHLTCGAMTPTVLDISAILGLPPVDFNLDVHQRLLEMYAEFDQSHGLFSSPKWNSSIRAYSSFLKDFKGKDGSPVTDEEHLAFLVYWLNKIIFCSPDNKISKELQKVAFALHAGISVNIPVLVLSHLYRGIYELISKQFKAAGGPLWILQLWLKSYFPELGSKLTDEPTGAFGYQLGQFPPTPKSLEECFRFFYDCASRPSYMPFPQHTGPPWHRIICTQAPASFKYDNHDVWADFVLCRDLPVSLCVDEENKSKFSVEIYLPNLVSRQFGLVQDVPFPFLETHNRQLIPRRKLTESDMSDVAAQFAKRKKDFRFCSFNFSQASSENFNSWWLKYIQGQKKEDWVQVWHRIAPQSGENVTKTSPSRGHEMKRKLSPQLHGLPIRINQVTMSSELQAPLGPGAESPATAIPKQKRIRKSGSGSYKETARRILDPEPLISTTSVCPDDSPVIQKAVDDIHTKEADVEVNLEEKFDKGGGKEMDFLKKTTAGMARESLEGDLLYPGLSKATSKVVDPLVGPYVSETPAISQQKGNLSPNDLSSSTSLDQVPLAPGLIPPLDPSKLCATESMAIRQQKDAPATKYPAASTSVDQMTSIGPSKSSVNEFQPKNTPGAQNSSSQTFGDQAPLNSQRILPTDPYDTSAPFADQAPLNSQWIHPSDPYNTSAPFDPVAIFKDLENFLELESFSDGFQLSSTNSEKTELSEEEFNKHVSTVKNLISFSLEAISHPGRLPVLISTCKSLLASGRLPCQQALYLQQLVNNLPYLTQRYEVATRELSELEKVLQEKDALLKELRTSFHLSKELTDRRSAIMIRHQEIEEAVHVLLAEGDALKKEDDRANEDLRLLAEKAATARSQYEEVKPQSQSILSKQIQVMADMDSIEKQWADIQGNQSYLP
ncbi:uncharacterized protein [Coffea arabica]|uniref:Uncharacterized protein isoform X1 n=2 Tax=Coffea arabica TaxID=13443 RepID=A0ABM4UI96_COFAR|nr:uncharacterized protein LOC113690860 [Coffea arabica]